MPKYNIIFTSAGNNTYLWNGTSLDKLAKADQAVLRFSGKDFKEDELPGAVKACRAFAKEMFPMDKEPEVKTVEIAVPD
jgi:hypothetical protein